jgi:phosphatidylglycerophosphate synthase
MIGGSIGRGASRIIAAMVRGLARRAVNPNTLTTTGVTINVICGLLFGFGYFFAAGLVLIVANLFDMLDGNLARSTGRVTRFGGFLDSSLDRLSDMVVFLASSSSMRAIRNFIPRSMSFSRRGDDRLFPCLLRERTRRERDPEVRCRVYASP